MTVDPAAKSASRSEISELSNLHLLAHIGKVTLEAPATELAPIDRVVHGRPQRGERLAVGGVRRVEEEGRAVSRALAVCQHAVQRRDVAVV